MPKYSTAFGMDVHLRSTTVCALDADTGEAVTRTFPATPGARSPGGSGWVPRATASRLRRLPRLRPAEGARRARRRVCRRRGLGIPGGSRLGLQERQERRRQDGQGDTRPRHLPRYGSPPPRSRASGTSPATKTGRPRAWRPTSSGLLAFLAKRGFAYGGTTPAGNPRKYWTYDFLRWLDKVRPEDDGGVRTLAALRSEVEAAAEARADLLSEYRAAMMPARSPRRPTALQSIKGCAFALAAAFWPRSATSRGSVPEGRSRPISASRRVEVERRLRAARRHQRCGQRACWC